MRLFVGIPLAEAVRTELAAMVARLKRGDDGLRWSAPESWHITLQFLGNTTEEKYACVTAALRTVKATPVAVQITEPGVFERAGIFHVEIALTEPLAELQRRVVEANERCGFGAEARPYHPHITLARIKRNSGGNAGHGTGHETGRGTGTSHPLQVLRAQVPRNSAFTRFVAGEFVLYESVPGPGGARYEVREWFAFKLVN